MPAYRHACDRCHERRALAILTEVRPGIFECTTDCQDKRRGRPADFAPAAQRARDAIRDAQVNALRGAPIPQDTRTRLNVWRADRQRAEHGGASW